MCSDAVPATALGAVAVMVTSPGASAVATPVALTVAIAGALEDHVNVVPATGWLDASNAEAVNVCVAPTAIDAVLGATVALATGAAGGPPASLQAPNVFVTGPVHAPVLLRCRDWPRGAPFSS